MSDDRLGLLIELWRDDRLSDRQADELNQTLRDSTEARQRFAAESALHGALHCAVAEEAVEQVSRMPETGDIDYANARRWTRSKWLTVLVAVAAGLLVAVGMRFWNSIGTTPIAILASSEDAAWESSLPTTPGSELRAGSLKLIAGIATIRFRSGAEVTMEAPANLELISPMRGRLLGGAAVVDVPVPAIGFVMETPDGYAVDHGTRFAVNVSGSAMTSDFEVIDGEISVHISSTGEKTRISDQQSASISNKKLTTYQGHLPERSLEQSDRLLRIGTEGRATSVVRNNNRKKRLHPDMLMVKRTESGTQDRRCLLSFDVSTVDLNNVSSVRLRLNLVPSGVGFASRLPKVNRFGVYGVTDATKNDWKIDSLWEDAPGPEDAVLLGTMELPRSQQRRSVGIGGDALLTFLKDHAGSPVTLIVARETSQVAGEGPGLVHAFANDSHPEASGPILEFETH